MQYQWIRKYYKFILFGTAVVMVGSCRFRHKLGDYQVDNPSLFQDPVQIGIEGKGKKPFNFSYRNKNYQVFPQAEYELTGIVATHNNITSLWDMYHDEDSVDTRDLCVIWGDNVRNQSYKKVKFSSGSWTCYVRWFTNNVGFNLRQFSNNHLITDNSKIRKRIGQVRIGDVVHIKGQLVNYIGSDNPGFVRTSSLTRDDKGNFACEVMFVRDIQVLKSPNKVWYYLYGWSRIFLVILLLLPLGEMIYRVHILKE